MHNEWEVSEQDRAQARDMAELGLPLQQIALLLNRPEEKVSQAYETELEKGTAETNYEALKVLRRLTMSGTCASATMFWVKTRCAVGTNGGANKSEPSFDPDDLKVISNSGKPPESR